MTSMMEELVNQIAFNVPEATAEQISDYLVQLMEKEILPQALRNATLPSRPSPLEEFRLRQWLKRVGKKRRPLEEKKLKSWHIIEQFELLKHAVNGHPLDISDLKRRELDYFDGTSVFKGMSPLHGTLLRRKPLRGDGIPVVEPGDVKKRIEKLEKVRPYSPFKEREEIESRFYFDRFVHDRISANQLFSRTVSTIESAAKLFALSKSIQANYFLSFRKDLEIPEWKKYILTMNVGGLDFEKKMKMWDEFDAFIRERIKERLLHAPEEEAEELKKLDKVLFTRFELGEETLAPVL